MILMCLIGLLKLINENTTNYSVSMNPLSKCCYEEGSDGKEKRYDQGSTSLTGLR